MIPDGTYMVTLRVMPASEQKPLQAPEAPEGVIIAPDWEKLAKTQAKAIDEACYWLVRGNPQKALTLLEALEQ